MTKNPLVLIVDDEADIRETVKNVLEDEGFKAITAKNGQDALEKIKKTKPDLIILDILMPGLTTKEIVLGIKKQKIRSPIIFLTVVKFSETVKQDIIKEYMADYIEKPFKNIQLIKRIKKVLKI